MKKLFVVVLVFVCIGMCAAEFTKPRSKEKKYSDAQLREQCCHDLGASVKCCARLHKTLADLEVDALSTVEDIIEGQAACSLVQKKGAELKGIVERVQQCTQQLADLERELTACATIVKSTRSPEKITG